MAGPIGRITASMATFYNENSASLINNSFDFTLIKLEAPSEFNALGVTISQRRKEDAEGGAIHRTARRLGALFGDLLPRTDDLFRAYGTRVSEISSILSINARENEAKAGIFASHIGVDTTSIWAAVTSGSAAIAVHLLACMLARIFSSSEAISLWVELVKKRRYFIQNGAESRLYNEEGLNSELAAKQDITRGELATWDASARAWLQSADQAKASNHKQTMLILDNTSVAVNDELEPYASVTKAWLAALEAMNNLVKGMPQIVHNGAALLAMSSWHLYPDMIVYGSRTVEVKQSDPLFDRPALLTLGLQQHRDDTKSVYWSLPLACMQYYGQAVQTSRSAGQDNWRINYHQFSYVILGCLFGSWQEFGATNEVGLQWIARIVDAVGLTQSHHLDKNVPSWLRYIIHTTREFAEADGAEKKVAQKLMNLGRRRSAFLTLPGAVPPPLFGLSGIGSLLQILSGHNERVDALRSLCSYLNLDGSLFLIMYKNLGRFSDTARIEYASAIPAQRITLNRFPGAEVNANDESTRRHVRWIVLNEQDLNLCSSWAGDPEDILGGIEKLKTLEEARLKPLRRDEDNGREDFIDLDFTTWSLEDMKVLQRIWKRRLEIEELGEICLPILGSTATHSMGDSQMISDSVLYASDESTFITAARDLDLRNINKSLVPVHPVFYTGDSGLATLLFIQNSKTRKKASDLSHLTPDYLEKEFVSYNIDQSALCFYFLEASGQVESQIGNLTACTLIADIYRLMTGATISTLVLNQSIYDAKWLKTSSSNMTLPQVFAGIAMFETGTCNLDPDVLSEAFAMSSGNSLYVAGALLCDPYERVENNEIRRITGNIGKAGINFLISPHDASIRKANPEQWMSVNHYHFDGEPMNYFEKTSAHLSFTEYELPLAITNNAQHTIDRSVILVESLISVYDKGTWVAEVDILKAIKSQTIERCPCPSHTIHEITGIIAQPYKEAVVKYQRLAAISIENWEELLDAPDFGVIAVRAHKNWIARLALLAVCVRQGCSLIILPEDPCWPCVGEQINLSKSYGSEKIALIY